MTQRKRPARLAARERSAHAKRVEAIYTFERNNWHRRRDRNNSSSSGDQPARYWKQSGNRSSVWDSLADLYHMNSIDIHSYIFYVFSHVDYILRPPTPNEIYPHQRLGKFREFVDDTTHGLKSSFSNYLKETMTKIGCTEWELKESGEYADDAERRKTAVLRVLLRYSNYLPAIYRYAIGRLLANDTVCKAHLIGAAVEYSRHSKSYDASWGFLLRESRQELLRVMDRILESETGILISRSESGK